MPKFLGLVDERGRQMRMGVAERVDGDAGGEIEIAFAVRGDEPYAFAPLEGEVDTRKGRHQMRCHVSPAKLAHSKLRIRCRAFQPARLKRNVPPLRAARNNILCPPVPLSTHDNCATRT